ncbi:hypothetical protein C8R46DRAFT_1214097 [Mycena filopes]|nr:hypothetical protein C8R46DRAFT_1214097 [Mycena filopes]
MPGLWSTITIFKTVAMDRLDFVLAQCEVSALHIKLHLPDLHSILGKPPTVWNLALLMDGIFERLAPSASRWKSFRLITENPFVFRRIQHHYKDLRVHALVDLHLAYVYMPGYSPRVHPLNTYNLPLQTMHWFSNNLTSFRSVNLFCAPVNWTAFRGFENLGLLELSDFFCLKLLDPGILPAIFALADRLTCLTLGALRPYDMPSGYLLRSTSLRLLDTGFYHPDFIGQFLKALDVPGLCTLVAPGGYPLSQSLFHHK